MRFSVKSNIDEVLGFTRRLHPQYRFAVAKGLTDTAKDVQQGVLARMRAVFDRPTPFTQRSMFVKPATKQTLIASAEIKDRFPSKALASPDEIYRHQIMRAPRVRKGLERAMTAAGFISSNEWLVPATGARLDAYGNMSRGQIAQLMSQLRLGLDPNSWSTSSRRSKASRQRAGEMFWSRGGHLRRGVWMRRGAGVIPIMVVVSRVDYQPRLDFDVVSRQIAESSMDRRLEEAWAYAKASAR